MNGRKSFNSFLASGHILVAIHCRLLIIFAISLEVGSDLDPNIFTLKDNSRRQQKHENLRSIQAVK